MDLPMDYREYDRQEAEINNNLYYFLRRGNVDKVERLLQSPLVGISGLYDALKIASEKGYLSIIEILIQLKHPIVDPSSNGNNAIRMASSYGHLSVVERLLQDPRVDPSCYGDEALQYASINGHLSVVKRLLMDPRVCLPSKIREVESRYEGTIRMAYNNRHFHIVRALLMDPRVDRMTWSCNSFRYARIRIDDICIALQNLRLAALITLEIIDALFPNNIPMHNKWLLITTVKHFYDKQKL